MPADVATKTADGVRPARGKLDDGVTNVKLTVAEKIAAHKEVRLERAQVEAAKARSMVDLRYTNK